MRAKRNSASRIIALAGILAVIFAVYVVRIMQLQLVDGEEYRAMGDVRYTREVTVKAARGEIVDRNGIPIAANRTAYNVVFDKSYVKMAEANEIILAAASVVSKQN